MTHHQPRHYQVKRLQNVKIVYILTALMLLGRAGLPVVGDNRPNVGSAELVVRAGRRVQVPTAPNDAPVAAVVFHSLDASMSRDLCASNNSDWRGSLPRFLAARLPRTAVLIWDGLATLSGQHADCRLCPTTPPPPLTAHHDNDKRFSCREWFASQAERSLPTAVVVMGSMDRTKEQCLQRCGDSCVPSVLPNDVAYPALHTALRQPWAKAASRTIHFPISHDKDVTSGRIVHFDTVIGDNGYLKPLEPPDHAQHPNLPGRRHTCTQTVVREPLLLYIARLTRGKGQEQFLRAVPASGLRGFTVAFYAGKRSAEAISLSARLFELAQQRNISIEVHLDRVDRGQLQQRACRASGLIHFPRKDRNPRVLYEALYFGLPVFVTSSSNAPRQLTEQPFAIAAPYFDPTDLRRGQSTVPAEFAKQFAKFMALARHPDRAADSMNSFVDTELSPKKVYGKICRRMKLCGRTTE